MLDFATLKTIFISLGCGIAFGATFSFAKLPLPAPITFAGIVGIFGVYLGYKIHLWVS
ncbi:hypothetical protein DID80_02860 [Candidatus Marinamargulisbacteria bacterium SCGC AAA071-K20]|nr:hypothetical protein DID80_02860 [Candidatus Marinamargulisbacteria bacterium SCGC AAA071-K20]